MFLNCKKNTEARSYQRDGRQKAFPNSPPPVHSSVKETWHWTFGAPSHPYGKFKCDKVKKKKKEFAILWASALRGGGREQNMNRREGGGGRKKRLQKMKKSSERQLMQYKQLWHKYWMNANKVFGMDVKRRAQTQQSPLLFIQLS